MKMLPHFDDVQAAAGRLQGVAHRTPALTSSFLDNLAGNQLFFKCENFQRTGAFKFRGAYNALAQLPPAQRRRGVVAYSSGNHAQGVALAAKLLGISAKIVMPNDAPAAKLAATRGYGAEVILYNRYEEDRAAIAREIQQNEQRALIPPFDHPHIIAGQGTIALELFEQTGALDILLAPIGGGGLISGNCISVHQISSTTQIYGVEAEVANDTYLSLQKGERVSIPVPPTIADGMQVTSPGELTFEIMREHLAGVLLVSEEEIKNAMRLVLERMKILVEPTGAVPVAAALKNELGWRGKRIGIIVSGGNVDMAKLAGVLSELKG
ncbi:MAG: threo-3-hydroxy-L-aspartate ammonia-lyase [candidate division KSB1 bacterium]|nr:threo-3-hydroxy-L-aspartate ammonia-lyase [candidate division KSB1 bacterium]MDZ7365906.1 threo-3-hydroxy-L-aspartate ammonia-lyase [candidate division KSB1 bacterium]MDZ7403860.1 threo-3-hydroxy-L-aspartate ammonia-lyase [candidate division KSB1 bacterium]